MNSDFQFALTGRARAALAVALIFSMGGVQAATPLPVPCPAGTGACGTNPSVSFALPGSGFGSTYATSTNSAIANYIPGTVDNFLTIYQNGQNAIFNWESFNIATGYGVHFQQPNAQSSALNRIWDANPSAIMGVLTATGTIYLINTNGIIFGNGAQVSVGSLVASSLNITDQRFLDGLLSKVDGVTPMFEGSTGFVKVLEGASIVTEKNGLVMMLAPTVLNAGTIQTPEGQTILGAGQKIWLAASGDSNLRGLVIEVDNPGVTTYSQANTALAEGALADEYRNPEYDMLGAVTNLGKIITERGNTTLIGHAVNQKGRISATTSVSLNGSIHLLAQDSTISSVASTFSNTKRDPQRAGRVVLGTGSITEILPEDSAETSIDSQAFALSQVKIVGKEIIMESGAGILAPAGVVNIKALANPSITNLDANTLTAAAAGVRVQFDPGSWINVAGLTDAAAPVSNNILAVELRGDELKDSPLQRNSFLRGQKVYVDVNKGTPLADISGYESQIGRTARARSTVGGTIKVQSEGEIVHQADASFDVSGGKITYTPGYVQTTQLISGGKLVDISAANPNVVYDGFADRIIIKDEKWGINETIFIGQSLRYDPGYIQGGNAGSVVFQAPALVLNGDLKANTVVGDFQRTAKTAPLGGSLQIGRAPNAGIPDYKVQQKVLFDYTQPQLAQGFKFGDSLAQSFKDTVVLNPAWFGQGFNRVAVYTNKGVSIVQDAPINIAPGGSFTVRASTADIAGNIVAPSGLIDIQTLETASFKSGDTLDLTVADGVLLSTGGQWVNDFLNPAQATGSALKDGGAITLSSAHDLMLGAGSVLDADGGAWVGINGKVQAGAGGDITLKAGNQDDANISTSPYTLSLGGELRSYSLKRGGKLTIQAPAKVQIGGVAPVPNTGISFLDTGFFSRGGFASFDVSGRKGLTVAEGANIDVRMSTLQLQPSYILAANGSNILDYSSVVLQPDALRKAADIKLGASNSLFGELVIGAGARIGVDPGGKIELSAGKQLTVYGELSAPAGKIVLTKDATSTFDATSSIWIASSAKLLVGGVARTTTNNLGLISGEVLDGGSITINADFRYLVVEKGAILDVSGTSAYLDIPTVGGGLGQVVASNAGSISLSAGEGMFFNGTVKAGAGGAQARGGSFSATLDGKRYELTEQALSYSTQERVLTLGETAAALPAGLIPGGAFNASDNGAGSINVKALVDAGVEQMTFKSSGSLVVDNLTVPKSANLRLIVLDAPKIKAQGAADLAASYVLAGNTDTRYQTAQAAAGSAELWLRGDFVDLIGKFAVNGVSDLHIESASDVRFLGVVSNENASKIETSDRLTGQMNVAGNVEFKAAQLYPATRTTFKVDVDAASGGTVTISPIAVNAALPAAPLSADGELIIRAPNIVQDGVLRAPFGVIDLEAYGTLTAKPGSLTSVAALGPDGKPLLIPYGRTDNELSWVYDIGSFSYEVGAVPEKRIRLSGQVLTVADGAQVDISAGGDLQAYEFFSGNGGSIDVLAQKGVYAILPGYTSKFAPWDVMQNSDLKPGDAVYLAGAPGLAAATYTLLPAHYALLPGAYAVKRSGNSAGLLPGFGSTQPDGSLIVPGYLTDSRGTARGAWNGFEVISKAIVRTQSEFALNTASNFFPKVLGLTQGLAQDAGRLSLVGQQALKFEGELIAAVVPGYRGAQLDISSNQLAIADASAVLPVGYVAIDPALLAGLPVESLFFGGTRRTVDGVVQIDDVASDVIVDTVAYGKVLAARELMFAATKSVTVRDGSQLAAYGDARNDAVVNYAVTGDGALLRLGADAATLTRSGAGSPPASGDLIVETGAELSTSHAAIFDATKNNQVSGTLNFKDGAGNQVTGGALTLGAERISFTGLGASAPKGTAGLVFDQTQLDNFSALDALNFTSYSGFDFYGAPVLGALDSKKVPLLDKLTLQGNALTGYGGTGSVATIQAANVVFQNPGAAIDTSVPPANAGELKINATRAIFGAGAKSIRGFETVTVNAGEIVARGVVDVGGTATNTTKVSGDVVLNAGRITGETGASQTLSASGLLTTLQNLLSSALAPATNLGANWTLEGSNVTHGGTVELPSGNVTLHATSGDVEVKGKVNTAGIVIPFFDVNVHSPGGTVTLTSDKGKVKILKNALVDVSGTAEADAGTLAVNATNGTVEIASGSILGDSTGAASGRFKLDVGSLADFGSLNRVLNTGGFHESRKLRVRNGDVTIPASETGADAVLAHDFQLTTDGSDSTNTKKTGNIIITGEVNAAGAKGGFIGFYAKNDVVLESGARLDASASKAGEHGGDIELFSTDGNLNLKSGSTVAASGGAGSWGGTLHLRAKRNSANNDVQVTALGSTFTGLDKILLEAYKLYTDSSISTSDTGTTGTWYTDAASFMYSPDANGVTNTQRIETRLGVAKNAQFELAPGIEIQSTGNLELANDWDLHTWRYDPVTGVVNSTSTTGLNADGLALTAGVLTLRATGDLNLNASLSDGFSLATTAGVLQGHNSWSYRLVAGADLDSPDPMAVNDKLTGNVNLASGKLLRTGSGDIEIAAGKNLDMSKAITSVIYTAGRLVGATDQVGFTPPASTQKYVANERGGDIKIEVDGDVLGYTGSPQLINQWLYRQGSLGADGNYDKQPAWWVRFDKFQQGIGALGGGDITINTGGNLVNVSAVIPTNAWMVSTTPSLANLRVRGGGDLTVNTGGDILSGLFYVADGVGKLRAGGSIGANPLASYAALHTLLALGDGQFKVWAAQDLALQSVFNPQVITQDTNNGTALNKLASAFFTYAPDSALMAAALTGDVTLYNSISELLLLKFGTVNLGNPRLVATYPGTVIAQALSGDVSVLGNMLMHAAPLGQLSLLAANDVILTGGIVMSDVDPLFASVLRPAPNPSAVATSYRDASYTGTAFHASKPVHENDAEPVRIYAAEGNIEGGGLVILPKRVLIQAGQDIHNLNLVAQHVMDTDVTRIEAGGDIVYDVTRIASTNKITTNGAGIQVGGPGVLELVAGGNLDLGTGLGVLTRGNLMNPALPSGGADVKVMVGLAAFDAALDKLRLDIGAELAATGTLSQALLDEARLISGNPALQPKDALIALSGATALSGAIDRLYLQINQSIASGALTDVLASSKALSVAANDLLIQARLLTGIDNLQPSAVLAGLSSLKTLPLAQQESRVREMVFEGARAAGRRATDPASEFFGNYDLGYKTIELAFPCIDCKDAAGKQKYYDGDINGFFSQVRTERGGGMDFLVPGGRWVVGLANVPAELITAKGGTGVDAANKAASQLGVVSAGDGDIRAVVYEDILVNQSRILTLTGSGMLLWSSENDIDAGKGKKTITSVPPPIVKVNSDGTISIEVQGAATGSGIGVLQTISGAPVEDAELYAPKGTINAGDAGIRAAGNLRLGALTVIGSDNISVGGVSVGVPAGESSSLAAGFAGASNLGDAASATGDITKSLSNQDSDEELKRIKQALAQFRPSFITVEVVGFGE